MNMLRLWMALLLKLVIESWSGVLMRNITLESNCLPMCLVIMLLSIACSSIIFILKILILLKVLLVYYPVIPTILIHFFEELLQEMLAYLLVSYAFRILVYHRVRVTEIHPMQILLYNLRIVSWWEACCDVFKLATVSALGLPNLSSWALKLSKLLSRCSTSCHAS